jgi:hypothetical protein
MTGEVQVLKSPRAGSRPGRLVPLAVAVAECVKFSDVKRGEHAPPLDRAEAIAAALRLGCPIYTNFWVYRCPTEAQPSREAT